MKTKPTMKDAVDAAVKAGLTPRQFVKLAEQAVRDEDVDYYPIKFALNRAVFHKELTAAQADKGIAELVALTAATESLERLVQMVCDGDEITLTDFDEAKTALNKLAAVRAGSEVAK